MKYLLTLSFLLCFEPCSVEAYTAYPASGYPTSSYPTNPHEPQTKRSQAFSEANASAIHFLNIIDNEQYTGSWLEAGELLQDVTTKEQWAGALKATREGLGLARTRTIDSHLVSKNLRNGTRGEFMTIKYNTQFSANPNAVETVILMRSGKLGLWRVVSYSVSNQ